MEFEDILEMLVNPGEEGAPADIFDQLRGAHTGALEARDSIIAEGTEALAQATAENEALGKSLVELKAFNWDKLENMGASTGADPDLNVETLDDKDTSGEMSTEDFFEKSEG